MNVDKLMDEVGKLVFPETNKTVTVPAGESKKIKINFILTCGACPEQYDAFEDGRLIGYLRLRSGFFTVDYIDGKGEYERVFEDCPEGDGVFADEVERQFYLIEAALALVKKMDTRVDCKCCGSD
jgi:hypothetical protein